MFIRRSCDSHPFRVHVWSGSPHSCRVTVDLDEFRFITASAYAGMMAPLTDLASTVCVLSGDTAVGAAGYGPERLSLEGLDGVRRRWRLGDLSRLADFVPKVLARSPDDPRPALVVPPRLTTAWEQACAGWPEVTLVTDN